MYEETKKSIDWKGVFLKVIIAFLVVLIAVKGYTTLKGNDNKTNNTTNATAESKSSSTFTANIEKLRNAGEKYYKENTSKLPTSDGTSSMVTLNELINAGVIETLSDEEGKTCDGESSYVTATLEGNKTKIKANLVCGSASSYSLVYMGENDSETKETTTTNSITTTKTETNTSSNKSTNSDKTTVSNSSTKTTNTPSISANASSSASSNVTINTQPEPTQSNNTNGNTSNVVNTKYYTVSFNSNGGSRYYADQRVKENGTASDPGVTLKSGYTFIGWYLNGSIYNFNTPVTSNIELIAKFVKNNSNSINWDDIEDWNYIYDNDDLSRYGYESDTLTKQVYSIGWFKENADEVTVNHTLRVPEEITELEEKYGYEIEKIRIKATSINSALTSANSILKWKQNHKETFLYADNNWEYDTYLNYKNLAKVSTSSSYTKIKVKDNDYKDYDDAIDEGFDVEWSTDYVVKQCSDPFNVYGPDGNIAYFNCGFGLIYNVTW